MRIPGSVPPERQAMKYPNLNVFAAWFLMPQTLFMGWLAAAGRSLLEVLGSPTTEGDIPGRLVGALLLFLLVYLVWHFRGSLPPQGRPGGNGYTLGHRLVWVGNALAVSLFLFHLVAVLVVDHNTHLLMEKATTASGYLCMGFFAIGFSLIYQSALPEEAR